MNFTNFAQFCKKERQKAKEMLFLLFTFREACHVKLFNTSFFIMLKIVFTKIIMFQISGLNA